MEVIRFNRNLYPLKAIKSAIKDYQHLARFKIKAQDNYFFIALDKIQPKVKNIIKEEFCNYVLANIRNY